MAKPLSFKDFIVVDYKPGEDELIKYAAHKRHRGRLGESTGCCPICCDCEKVNAGQTCHCDPCNCCTCGTETNEALNFRQRRARAISMKKNKAKIAMGRRRAAKKAASKETILKRARRQAIKTIFKKLSKGTPKTELPPSRRQEIEKRLGKMKVKIDRLAKRSVKDVRQREKERKMQKAD